MAARSAMMGATSVCSCAWAASTPASALIAAFTAARSARMAWNAAVASVRFYGLAGRTLRPLTRATFAYQGSLCCGGDIVCRGRDVLVASSYGHDEWSVYYGEERYRFDGRRLVESGSFSRRQPFDVREFPPRTRGRRCIDPPSPAAEQILFRLWNGEPV